MRRIQNFQTVAFSNDMSPRDFIRMCSELVGDGYQPYGKVYYHGDWMFRDFVKYSYNEDDMDLEFYEDEEGEDGGGENPWETTDFFVGVEDE